MNIFFKLGKWWEDRKSVNHLDFEQRVRLIEESQKAQMKMNQSMMIRLRKMEEYTQIRNSPSSRE